MMSRTPTIDVGLARFEVDYYAILGVPLSADTPTIRKGYIQVAKHLHPDRFIGKPDQREVANWLFSKLISPAHEVMNKEKERVEYREILRLHVKRLKSMPVAEVWPDSYLADSLQQSADLDKTYADIIAKLAQSQYRDLDKALERTGELSKVNLAYLLLSAGYTLAAKPSIKPAAASTPPAGVTFGGPSPAPSPSINRPTAPPPHPPAPTAAAQPPAAPPVTPSSVRSPAAPPQSSPPQSPSPSPPEGENPAVANPTTTRYQQAQQMIQRGQYKEAIQFLNIAISSETNNPDLYLGRARAYLKMKNTSRARLDLQKVLALAPENEEARRYLQSIELASEPANRPNRATPNPIPPKSAVSPPPPSNAKKGFLGRLFDR
jgi:tetratricopeptide (TPR) repeat protein